MIETTETVGMEVDDVKISNHKLDVILARRCMTRRDLRGIGASAQTMQRIGRGEEVLPRTAGRIAQALRVDVEDLLDQEGA